MVGTSSKAVVTFHDFSRQVVNRKICIPLTLWAEFGSVM
jgi:hypothetical protein